MGLLRENISLAYVGVIASKAKQSRSDEVSPIEIASSLRFSQ
jgi:hypothetical protein